MEKKTGKMRGMRPVNPGSCACDERYDGDGYGRALWTVDAVHDLAVRLHLPVERVDSTRPTLAVTVVDDGFGCPRTCWLVGGGDGAVIGWIMGGVACAADHVRAKGLDDGSLRLAFYRRSVITGYVTVPSDLRAAGVCLLASAARVCAWLGEHRIVPSIAIHGISLTLKVRTISDGLARFGFTMMDDGYVIDSLTVGGKEMRAYGIDMRRSRDEGWGVIRMRVRVARPDGGFGYEELRVGIPGSGAWLDEETTGMLG